MNIFPSVDSEDIVQSTMNQEEIASDIRSRRCGSVFGGTCNRTGRSAPRSGDCAAPIRVVILSRSINLTS
jgi:hypothetical protein